MRLETNLNGEFPGESAVALGFFDGVHLGHRAVIGAAKEAAGAGAETIVFSFSLTDLLPQQKNGAKWLTTDAQKACKCEALGVDRLLLPPFSAIAGLSPEEFADLLTTRLHAKTVACGYDYRFGRGASGTAEDLRRLLAPHGAEVVCVPAVLEGGEPVSSSRIRALLAAGEAEAANRLLGAPFALVSDVVHGRGIGRQLGFPTANQRFPADFLVPRHGVYAARATVEGRAYPAVTNVGVKPTVGDDRPGAESCLIGFSGDLYGREITVEFLQFLREERKFPDLESLRAQIARDAERASAIA